MINKHILGLLGSTPGGGAGNTPTNNPRNKEDGGTPSVRSKTRSIGPQLPVARKTYILKNFNILIFTSS